MRPALFNQLYVRLALALVALFALVGLAFAFILSNFESMYQEEMTQRANADLAATLAREHRAIGGGVLDASSFADVLAYVKRINPSVDVYLLDAQGTVRAHSDPQGPLARPQVDLKPVRAFIDRKSMMPLHGIDPRNPTRTCIFSAAPIGSADEPMGYVYVVLGQAETASQAMASSRGYVVPLILGALVASLLFALVAALVLFRVLTRRLRRLTSAVEGFRANGFTAPPVLPALAGAQDEIARLTTVFGEVGDRMLAQLKQLRLVDEGRRTAVLNASHDLRTPLAALRGYLQTLLMKRDALSSAQQLHYLEVANRHAERLSRLVEQMFELAKLDAPETAPRKELFSLSELISDIGQKYRLSAESRRIRLEVMADPDVPAVFADIAMVERLVENLVENALKFTPAGGTVALKVTGESGSTVLAVSDTGCGIADEDLPHVFERFYRASKAGRDGSAGLGLAIVKRVAELHEARLAIQSVVERGTTIETTFFPQGVSKLTP
jgi:two-component system, OmpR family, sensor kinase